MVFLYEYIRIFFRIIFHTNIFRRKNLYIQIFSDTIIRSYHIRIIFFIQIYLDLRWYYFYDTNIFGYLSVSFLDVNIFKYSFVSQIYICHALQWTSTSRKLELLRATGISLILNISMLLKTIFL